MIGVMPAEEAVAEAVASCAEGVSALQIKGGEDASCDVELVEAIRTRVGPEIFLRLDANQGYGNAKNASRILSALRGKLQLAEQPVADRAEMRSLRQMIDIDVIADESCWDIHDLLDVIAAKASDAISIYLAKAGGIARARTVAAVAHAVGLPCDVNGSLESAIGNAANLHFAMAMPAVTLQCVIPITAPADHRTTEIAGRYYEDDVVDEAFPFEAGALLPLDRPGLGINVNRAKLDRYREA